MEFVRKVGFFVYCCLWMSKLLVNNQKFRGLSVINSWQNQIMITLNAIFLQTTLLTAYGTDTEKFCLKAFIQAVTCFLSLQQILMKSPMQTFVFISLGKELIILLLTRLQVYKLSQNVFIVSEQTENSMACESRVHSSNSFV